MEFFDNVKFDQINPNNLSAKFLKVREYFFTKNKISVFANKLFNCSPTSGSCKIHNIFQANLGNMDKKGELWSMIVGNIALTQVSELCSRLM